MELNISELRRCLFTLINAIPAEGITITRRGKAIAQLVSIAAPCRGRRVTFPLIRSKGKPGPLAPTTKNPHDLTVP
jgi:antitoxin (DNA-binding transcriptional repressor) of toxin-antitoxin stability system